MPIWNVAGKLCIDTTPSNIAMEGRVGPVDRSRYEPMFHRVHPTIPEVRVIVGLVLDMVFPKAALPYPGILLGALAGTSGIAKIVDHGGLQTHPTLGTDML